MELDVSNLTQVAFSIGVAWYLLTTISKKLDSLAKLVEESSEFNKNTLGMFSEIKTLIKDTSNLVQTTAESVKIMNELTKNTLRQLEELQWQKRRSQEDDEKRDV